MERWIEEIEGWEPRPVAAGFDGLRPLAADEFSGAVSAGDTWLFLVNGRGVGIFERASETAAAPPTVSRGALAALEGADLTARAAPHHSIPLLVAMQAGETTPRARYYTEDTPIPEVHETLTEGGFTGYLELSENVLSGDYYVVYQAGRAAEVAFIGNSRRVESGDDAFERACDEVGIYEVVAASIEPVDLPEPGPEPSADAASGAAVAASEDDPGHDRGNTDADARSSSGAGTPDVSLGDDVTVDDSAGSSSGSDRSHATDATDAAGASGPSDAADAAATGSDPSAESSGAGSLDSLDAYDAGGSSEPADDDAAGADDGPGGAAAGSGVDRSDGDAAADEDGDGTDDAVTDRTAGGRTAGDETTGVAEPSETTPAGEATSAITEVDDGNKPAGGTGTTAGATDDTPTGTTDDASGTDGSSGGDAGASAPGAASAESAADAERVAALRDRLAEREAELDAARSERDELAARVSELEATVEKLRAGGGSSGPTAAGESLPVADALAGTNLFIRYRSKGAATLSDAVGGDASREELADNLRIEHHTDFEAGGATVDGEPFETWLTGTHQFRFLRWLVTTLPFEIRETRSHEALRDLYGAFPEIDRVGLGGSVSTGPDASAEFDLVALDQMGDPLVVAEIHPDREPIAETGVADLVESATSVAQAHPDLAAAFHVTEAFFRPRAMETAREATSGSLLSRDSRGSFVKISRNRGYHLCLVEARDDSYYLSVPDL